MRLRKNHLLISMSFLATCTLWSLGHATYSAKAAESQLTEAPVTSTWQYPVASHQIIRDFLAPTSDFSAGHRGVDFAAVEGEPVTSVASGTVRFAGVVAGRNLISLTLDSGLVAELEPVCTSLKTGDPVASAEVIGTVCSSQSPSHCSSGCLHLSARRFSAAYSRGYAYFSPLLFLASYSQSHLVAINSMN